jgi:endonuclease/exonuclease/phosphatase family metal-dependent hydrolase
VDFLNELSSVAPVSQMQWIVLGDFNMIYEARDRSNLNLSRQLMGRFRRALDRCKLFELALQNHKYTWSNDRAQPTLVRLDRVFCNKAWDLHHRLQALSSSLSDHSPLLLCHQDKPLSVTPFSLRIFGSTSLALRTLCRRLGMKMCLVYHQ